MARKKNFHPKEDLPPAIKEVESFSLAELKRQCISRGMPFYNMVGSSIPQLQTWFINHYPNPIDPTLVNQFDEWMDKLLLERNASSLIHPSLRLGYTGIPLPDEKVPVPKLKSMKLVKSSTKKEKTIGGVFKGTKKALTFECYSKGKTKAETIEIVMKTFPEALEKSIIIWYNKAKKQIG